ncbi:MAG: translation initiation factor 2 [Oscillospiraceae bacterium]|nr:translation initiation factor 2 [Oscillospiraceae bacterium]
MVKGVSRQVIVVHSPDPKLFDQAIFILKDEAVGQEGITDELLLKEAKQMIHNPVRRKKMPLYLYGPIWACGGALVTGIVWLLTVWL